MYSFKSQPLKFIMEFSEISIKISSYLQLLSLVEISGFMNDQLHFHYFFYDIKQDMTKHIADHLVLRKYVVNDI